MGYIAIKSSLLQAIRIPSLFNYFYSLRDLERLLGISFQNLWKYVNLVSVPMRSTIDKILKRVEGLKLMDRILSEIVNHFDNVAALTGNPGFLKLFSILVAKIVGSTKVDTVILLSLEAIPLATVVTLETNSTVRHVYSHDVRIATHENYMVSHYVSQTHELRFIAIPKSCLKPRSKVVLVETVIEDLNKIATIIDLLKKRMCVPTLLIAIDSVENAYSIAQRYKLHVKVLREAVNN